MKHQIRWTVKKIQQRLDLIEPLIYRKRHTLPSFQYYELDSPLATAPIGTQVDTSQWATIAPYDYWARAKTNFVLRTTFQTPEDWSSHHPVALYLPLGEPGSFSHPEALIYVDEQAFAATDRHHQEVLLPAQYVDGEAHHLALHGWSGDRNQQDARARLFMKPCELVQIDQPTRDFHALARTALGVAKHLDAESVVRGKLLDALDAAFITLDTRDPLGEAFYASVAAAMTTLQAKIASAGAPLDVSIAAAGHAHIDVAWLWTLGQTRRKAERTFHTVLHLMEQFPNYKFTQSQPQLYDYMREDQPALFEAIKQRVAEKRWEPIGGMWVEADCNLTGSEALVRQFVLGRHFFRKHFGADAESPVLWLPDVFGYAWALPQIIKKSGLDYFMTIKIAWNQYNRFPYDSFWWQGLDGTRVLTHFSPTPEDGVETRSTYNAKARPQDALDTWTYFLQKEEQTDLLMSFGYGDGGGGPTREMLETIRDLEQFPGAPKMRHDSVINFFRKLDAEAGAGLPTWNGELYLEYHRGTYTTQARNKRDNRRSEIMLHDAEFLCVLATLLDANFEYPADTINKAWELTCLNQFHDILPGSSIHDVYEDSDRDYEQIASLVSLASDRAWDVIAPSIAADIIAINPTSFVRDDLITWDGELPDHMMITTADGTPLPVQRASEQILIAPPALNPYSVIGLKVIEGQAPKAAAHIQAASDYLENDFVRVELTADGDIARIYDKQQGREVLAPDTVANQFQAFEDRPMFWDAWDIDIFYDDKYWLSEPASTIEVIESGPLRATIEIQRKILNSHYTQRICVMHNSPQIRIETTIDWQERHILLKTAFPVDILSPTATYDIQWGNVERPTHRNTSWDWARFETCAHKWVDLSEADYGVSLLNDCKYGHDIHDNVMRLSLLKGSTYPDPTADLGQHTFTYSLLPHAGDWRTMTIATAYALNEPLIVRSSKAQASAAASNAGGVLAGLVSVDAENVVIETIKQAEDGKGIIVRLYEAHRKRKTITLTTAFDLKAVALTNLIEDDLEPVDFAARQITLPIKPYEIITLRLVGGGH